ncbi:MAG: DUF2089 domain-containing protein [Anaerolineales bacterium]|jgi:hypothetical protein
MHPIPSQCPICGGEIIVTEIQCRDCNTKIEGQFYSRTFSQLTPKQMEFVETFIRLEGKITHMEKELNLSYPTIRKLLHDVIRALGYEPGGEEELAELSEEDRQKILNELDSGEISLEDALKKLQDEES